MLDAAILKRIVFFIIRVNLIVRWGKFHYFEIDRLDYYLCFVMGMCFFVCSTEEYDEWRLLGNRFIVRG